VVTPFSKICSFVGGEDTSFFIWENKKFTSSSSSSLLIKNTKKKKRAISLIVALVFACRSHFYNRVTMRVFCPTNALQSTYKNVI
jgi:hypothetical protein